MFALIGLQLWAIVTAPDIGRAPTLLISGGGAADGDPDPADLDLPDRRGRPAAPPPRPIGSWRPLVAVSWAGMRGVVSLAAAQTLPLDTPVPLAAADLHDRGHPRHPGGAGAVAARGDQAAAPARRSGGRHPAGTGGSPRAGQSGHRGRVEEVIADRPVARAGGAPDARLGGQPGLAGAHRTRWTDPVGDASDRLDRISGWRHELVGIERDVFVNDAQLRSDLRGRAAGAAVRPRPGGGAAGPAVGGCHRAPRQLTTAAFDDSETRRRPPERCGFSDRTVRAPDSTGR